MEEQKSECPSFIKKTDNKHHQGYQRGHKSENLTAKVKQFG